jgi:hypothetical protein
MVRRGDRYVGDQCDGPEYLSERGHRGRAAKEPRVQYSRRQGRVGQSKGGGPDARDSGTGVVRAAGDECLAFLLKRQAGRERRVTKTAIWRLMSATRGSARGRTITGCFLAAWLLTAGAPLTARADVRSSIVSIAESQDQHGSAIADNPANSACNPYSAYFGDGTGGCGSGLRKNEWCADFAAWAWRQAGVNFVYGFSGSEINAWSASFYKWGVATGNWHPLGGGYAPQPGDVAVYGNLTEAPGPGHVGIYVGGSATSPTIVNGNWATNWPNPTNYGVIVQSAESSTGEPGGGLDGYVSPSSSGGDPSGPTVTTTSLPAVIVGDNYGTALSATGGTEPYAWQVIRGDPPTGLSLNNDGTFSGVASVAGSFSFEVSVTDGNNAKATAELSIEVEPNFTNVAAPGAAGTLDLDENEYGNAHWSSSEIAGAGAAASAPAIAEMANEETVVAVEGPDNSLDVYFRGPGSSTWLKNVVGGSGTAFSAPAVAEMSNDETVVAVQGPDRSLDVYFNAAGDPNWSENTPAGANTTYSAPSVAEMSNNETVVAAEGAKESLDVYFNADGDPNWLKNTPAGSKTTYSPPSVAEMSNNETVVAAEGAKKALDVYFNAAGDPNWSENSAAGPGTTFGVGALAVPKLD